jgi:ribosome-binding ATPase YchF (GTP1/OBG family)
MNVISLQHIVHERFKATFVCTYFECGVCYCISYRIKKSRKIARKILKLLPSIHMWKTSLARLLHTQAHQLFVGNPSETAFAIKLQIKQGAFE